MRTVQAEEPGISLKLHPQMQDKIVTTRTDDDQSIVIVRGVVVRVDVPDARLREAMNTPLGVPFAKPYPLLVETDEPPTPVARPFDRLLDTAEQNARLLQLAQEAAQLGFSLQPATIQPGDASDIVTHRTIAGEVTKPVADPTKAPKGDAKLKAALEQAATATE